MISLKTSRFYEKRNKNKIALNLFQGEIDDYDCNENDEYEDILTKRGKVKNKSKIEYFKNYINNFKETKFKTARPFEIFRKKEDKKQKEIPEENLNIKKGNIQKNQENTNNSRFNLIKEKFREERQEQMENLNDNIINKGNEIKNANLDKRKNNRKGINDKIIKNNEVLLNKIKKNKNVTKIVEKEKEKIKKKIMNFKEKAKPNNLSTGKALELLDKDNEKFFKLIKAKKMRKTLKKKLNKSFNNSYHKEKFFFNGVEISRNTPIIKTDSNENTKRKMKNIRNKLQMKIIYANDNHINNIIEKEMFNKKRINSNKVSKYLSKSCSNTKDKMKYNSEKNNIEMTKICKNQKQYIKLKINNQISEPQNE